MLSAKGPDAAIDRFGSTKGDKDAKDLVNLVVALDQPRSNLLLPILAEERLDFLRTLGRGSEPFQTMSGGNSHQSSVLRDTSSMTEAERKAKQRSHAIQAMCYVCLTARAREHRSTCASCAAYHARAQRTRRANRHRNP